MPCAAGYAARVFVGLNHPMATRSGRRIILPLPLCRWPGRVWRCQIAVVCGASPGRRLRRGLAVVLATWGSVALAADGGGEAGGMPPAMAGAASFYVRSWTVDDGTSANTVMSALRRADGYLWVATRTGLFRFNGEEFKSVPRVSAAALPDIVSPSICEDSRGRMWLGKFGIVACVGGADLRVFRVGDGLPEQRPCAMVEDKDGSMWVSYKSASVLLCRIREGKVEALGPVAAGVSGDIETMLVRGPLGPIWFVSGCQVGVLRDGRLVTLLTRERSVTCIAAAGRGGVWFSDGTGVWSAREDGRVEPLGEVPGGMVSVLHEDGRGQLWVACNSEKTAALFLYENNQFRQVPVVCPHVMSLADDREGNLWVSTRRMGLIQVRLRTVELVKPISDMLAGVQSFCEDRGGMRFAVSVNGLLASSQGDAWREMTEPLGWRGGYAECVAADPLGGVWLGTREHGLMQWRSGVFSGVDGTDDPGVRWVRSLLPGSDNTLWFGTLERRFYHLHDGRLTQFPVPRAPGYVGALAEDAGKNIWAATQDGLLLRVKGDSLVNETPQVSKPPDAIRCLHATPDGSLWIGYATCGLGRLKQGVFQRFSQDQGIEEKSVSQILTANGDGWLWCAGDRGIFRVKLAELEAVAAGKPGKVQPVLCGRGEGWPVMQASCENWPQAALSRSGELYMPMASGMAIVHPQRCLEHPPEPPMVLIDRLAVNGRSVAVYESGLIADGESGGPPPEELRGHSGGLSLGRGVRQLEIDYDVVSFTGRENVRFRYRLEGLDETWVEAGPQRVAYFSMVPPGRYRFQVTACNNHGVWNDTGTSLDFTVVPYYWQTSWFLGLLLMAATGIVGGIVWLEMRRRHRRKLERLEREQALERERAEHKRVLEEERARIARDLHDDLGASLTEVAVLAGSGQHAPAADQTPGLFEAIGGKSRQMVAALDAIVWAVDPEEDSLQSLVDYLAGFAGDYLAPSEIACRFDIPVAFPDIQLPGNVRHGLFLIVKETLHNAVQHAGATEVTCHIAFDHPLLRISIADNGTGFDVSAAPEGHGLRNFADRLNPLGGAYAIDSRPGCGTTVNITLSVGDATAATPPAPHDK